MKKQLLLATVALIAVVFASWSCDRSHPNTVSGTVDGLENDTLLVRYNTAERSPADTVIMTGNTFTFTPAHKDVFANIYFKSLIYSDKHIDLLPAQSIELYIADGDEIRIAAVSEPKFLAYTVEGTSAMSRDLAAIHAQTRDALIEIGRIKAEVINYIESTPASEVDQATWLEIRDSQEPYLKEIEEAKNEFFHNNPDSDLSGYYFANYIIKGDVDETHAVLTERVKNGLFGKEISETYKRMLKYRDARRNREIVVAGAPAPAFTLKDVNGETVSLEDFKGKYVAVDFWGTWCGPCVMGMPKMKQYSEKYADKIVFISIANNEKEEKWRSFLTENNYDWVQLLETEDDTTYADYGVSGFPTKFILDQDHNIVEKFVGEREFFYNKLDELFGK